MWDKAYILAIMIIGCNFSAGLLIGFLKGLFNIRLSGLLFVIEFMAPYAVGQYYAQNRGNVIPRSLGLWTSTYTVLVSVCISAVDLLAMNAPGLIGLFPVLGLLGLASVIRFMLTYWVLSFGSKAYIKKTRK